MAKITYLFGAGASANALPIVSGIPKALQYFKADFIKFKQEDNNPIKGLDNVTIQDAEKKFANALDVLIKTVPKHASIDTYAKKLFITHDNEKYRELKSVFSCFLSYLQLKNPVDIRYDSFFASILNKSDSDFISPLNILSWNYDFQFEKAYSQFSLEGNLERLLGRLNVNFRGSRLKDVTTSQSFGIYKLNGTVGYLSSSYHPVLNRVDDADYRSFFRNYIIKHVDFCREGSQLRSSLNFAWENPDDIYYTGLANIIQGTTALVIIGYSFPFFNRPLDKRIIGALAQSSTKVYIQYIPAKCS